MSDLLIITTVDNDVACLQSETSHFTLTFSVRNGIRNGLCECVWTQCFLKKLMLLN